MIRSRLRWAWHYALYFWHYSDTEVDGDNTVWMKCSCGHRWQVWKP